MFCVFVHPNNLVMWNCLTCRQLASLLGMYPRTLWRYDREGKIPRPQRWYPVPLGSNLQMGSRPPPVIARILSLRSIQTQVIRST